MMETLRRTGRPVYLSGWGERRFAFLLYPYRPFRDHGGAVVDGYYPASNESYHNAGQLSKALAALGIQNVFSPGIDYKGVLSRASQDFLIGENTLLYHRDYGSRFCIEALEIFEEIPLPSVQPGGCLSCGACRGACPTGAIGEGSFDRGKCLREIMNQTSFSDETAKKIGRRLYGCDLCQRVCPLNGEAVEIENPHAEFLRYRNLLRLSGSRRELEPLEPLLGKNYLRPRRILNLAAVGAGNSGDPSLIPLLEGLLGREDPDLRENAARSIRLLRG